MSKYGSGLTTNDVCKLECKEAEEILDRYHVSNEDKENITGMIEEAYYLLSQSYKSGKAMEKILEDKGFKPGDYFQEYLRQINSPENADN